MTKRIVIDIAIPTPKTCGHHHQAAYVEHDLLTGEYWAECLHGHRWQATSVRRESLPSNSTLEDVKKGLGCS